MDYFSDREHGPRARTREDIDNVAWGGILVLMESRLADGSLAYRYPVLCQDVERAAPYASDEEQFWRAARAEVSLPAGLDAYNEPASADILDLIEFAHRVVADPIEAGRHAYYGHTHLRF